MPTAAVLLDAEGWGEVLELFTRSADLSVILLDHEGQIIGCCHNPKPIWILARNARPDWGASCPLCLNRGGHCTAIADAERTRSLVVAQGLGGFVHTAAPLFLEGQHLGTLLAGQVFDHYPEMLLLEQVAEEFHLSGQELWDLARRRVPISRATLIGYGDLLWTLGNAYLRERYAIVLRKELVEANEKLRCSNEDLRLKVEELDQSLVEKDVLLNEVHHRVNNNLSVIGSLLRMQAEAFPDRQVADALRESQLRVDAMALIHAHLYNANDWSAVNFAQYAEVLASNLLRAYGVDPARIAWRVELRPFKLSVERAIPAGLILSELISNALKHAFPGDRHGVIIIKGHLEDGRIELSVEDDGAGIAEKAPGGRQSLGLKIVHILTKQLKGTFIEPRPGSPGSTFRVSFPSMPQARSTAAK